MIDFFKTQDTGGWISYIILTIDMLFGVMFLASELFDEGKAWKRILYSFLVIFGGYHLLIFLTKII